MERLKNNKNVKSPIPAERRPMKATLGELLEFKELVARGANQTNEL